MAKADKKPEPEAKPKCFIIMPITMPSHMLDKYSDGPDHFTHILTSLFIPAIEQAGFEPVPPTAKGSEIIQAGIITNLIEADIVLCDISCFNPNVFFEFGIRTALDKPTCVVKDDKSPEAAFDTAIIHYHTYKSPLYAHQKDDEILHLAKHVLDTLDNSNGQNAMWQLLGYEIAGQLAKGGGDTAALIRSMSSALSNKIAGLQQSLSVSTQVHNPPAPANTSMVPSFLSDYLPDDAYDGSFSTSNLHPYDVTVYLTKPLLPTVAKKIRRRARLELGLDLVFTTFRSE